MKKKIWTNTVIIALTGVFLSMMLAAIVTEGKVANATKHNMTTLLSSAVQNFDIHKQTQQEVDRVAKGMPGIRVTVLDKDGNVMADSEEEAQTLENHGSREEIVAAQESAFGIATRKSASTGKSTMYVAGRMRNGDLLRVATAYPDVLDAVAGLIPATLVGFAVVAGAIYCIGKKTTDKLMAPMDDFALHLVAVRRGENFLKPEEYGYSELQEVAGEINRLTRCVQDANLDLEDERDKTNYIIDSLKEGVILISNLGDVLFINKPAIKILSAEGDIAGKKLNRVTPERKLIKTIELAIADNKNMVGSFSIKDGRSIETTVNILGGGVLVIMNDVTAIKKAVEVRSEFFANANHELKTPITSISGFAELLYDSVDKNSSAKSHAGHILKESKRLKQLVDDIVNLSAIEASTSTRPLKKVSFKKIIEDSVEISEPLAGYNSIAINTEVENLEIMGDEQELCSMIGNLIQNAVLYNKPNGFVDVKLYKSGDNIILKVANTGGYIPREYHERIFERFFRVEAGRSKEKGGTGLGLAIVKHIALIYNATISVDSTHERTVFTVKF